MLIAACSSSALERHVMSPFLGQSPPDRMPGRRPPAPRSIVAARRCRAAPSGARPGGTPDGARRGRGTAGRDAGMRPGPGAGHDGRERATEPSGCRCRPRPPRHAAGRTCPRGHGNPRRYAQVTGWPHGVPPTSLPPDHVPAESGVAVTSPVSGATAVPDCVSGSDPAVSGRMSMRQPVNRAASRAFCPSRPIASDNW